MVQSLAKMVQLVFYRRIEARCSCLLACTLPLDRIVIVCKQGLFFNCSKIAVKSMNSLALSTLTVSIISPYDPHSLR